MNTFSRMRRGLIFATVLLTLVLSGATVPPSKVSSKSAYPLYSKEITYYSNASYSQVVGVGVIYCNGTSTLTGTSTQYRTEEILDVCCPDPGGNGGVPC